MLRSSPPPAAAGLALALWIGGAPLAVPVRTAAAGPSGRASTHFHVQTVDGPVSDRLQREALAALEGWYRRFLIVFESQPATPIPVLLHPARRFHIDTGAPAWADGVYASDGAIQVAVGGRARVDDELGRVLGHELAHAFITHLSGGRAPTWLQEGLAQALTESGPGARGAATALDGPDTLDHAGSLSFTRALLARSGAAALRDALADLGAGRSLEEALTNRLGAGPDRLYSGWLAAGPTLARGPGGEPGP